MMAPVEAEASASMARSCRSSRHLVAPCWQDLQIRPNLRQEKLRSPKPDVARPILSPTLGLPHARERERRHRPRRETRNAAPSRQRAQTDRQPTTLSDTTDASGIAARATTLAFDSWLHAFHPSRPQSALVGLASDHGLHGRRKRDGEQTAEERHDAQRPGGSGPRHAEQGQRSRPKPRESSDSIQCKAPCWQDLRSHAHGDLPCLAPCAGPPPAALRASDRMASKAALRASDRTASNSPRLRRSSGLACRWPSLLCCAAQ